MIFLPAGPELAHGDGHFLERGLAGAGEIIELQHDGRDARSSFAAARMDSVRSQSRVSVWRWPRASLKAICERIAGALLDDLARRAG